MSERDKGRIGKFFDSIADKIEGREPDRSKTVDGLLAQSLRQAGAMTNVATFRSAIDDALYLPVLYNKPVVRAVIAQHVQDVPTKLTDNTAKLPEELRGRTDFVAHIIAAINLKQYPFHNQFVVSEARNSIELERGSEVTGEEYTTMTRTYEDMVTTGLIKTKARGEYLQDVYLTEKLDPLLGER